jgi:hypothetical protein
MLDPMHAAFWERADRPGKESFLLSEDDRGVRLEGSLTLESEGSWRIRYEIAAGPDWDTRAARVEAEAGDVSRELVLEVDASRRWKSPASGREIPELAGCVDVDVSFSPSTNVLPIRRLGLAVGESADVVAAWILLPRLDVKPLSQRYTRVAERRYRYESRGGVFAVELDVDARGLVLDYPPFWKRVSARSRGR